MVENHHTRTNSTMEEVIIRVFKSSEGTIMGDIYIDPKDVELPEDSDDGFECTSVKKTELLRFKDAMHMGVWQALALIKRKK